MTLRPELCSDPALKVMAARLSLALGGLDHEEAARLLLHLGHPTRELPALTLRRPAASASPLAASSRQGGGNSPSSFPPRTQRGIRT